ncbi:hypothetical protein [Flavobacterium sp. AG291]|uniref:hypothetical protein n=1 Tax=Flavobacterium sp. AG291 TaxID=2184000 RepID=UPI000E0CB6DA|nr:hypothetical protein [Flavobacterium sp. AG291]RDI11959.1 hypothetical protein DEU42_105121 [Flavobacterium sp. AG291]
MPLNLLKNYNQLLDIAGLSHAQRIVSLKGVFGRDVIDNKNFTFLNKKITPTPEDGVIEMETLFRHLTTVVVDPQTKQRDFDIHRSQRLHWLKYHLEQRKVNNVICFTVKEPEGYRTYIYDIDEKYVIVLEPKYNNTIYFLLTAYHLRGRDAQRDKMLKKYKRRIDGIL